MKFILTSYALQDIGKRDNQEDCFYPPFLDPCHYDATAREWVFYDGTARTDDRLFMVCDGMGGHDRGEVASQTVIKSMSDYLRQNATVDGEFPDELLRQAVNKALDDLEVLDDLLEKRKMGTTMSLLKFHSGGATVGHIGDSRVYHFRPAQKGHSAQMLFSTEDHIMINDMVRHGQMTSEQAAHSTQKHILSRAMTSARDYRPDVEISHITDILPGDIFMLCSDGMYENLTNQQLCELVCDPNNGDAERIQSLLQQTLENRDNHTAVIIRIQNVLNVSGQKMSTEEMLPPGTTVNSKNYTYHIEKVLGHGAFGITYLANTSVAMQGPLGTIHTEVKMALKEFFMHGYMKRLGTEVQESSKSDVVNQYAAKFRNEAAKLAMFSHPHIVRVLEVFEDNNTIYYSMENLPGGSLNEYINKRDGLSEQEAIQCIRQIGSALTYMHTNKVLHLDVKPANVMLVDGINNLKLIDYGLAKRYEENGDATSTAFLGSGTSGYAPLEQAGRFVDKDKEKNGQVTLPFNPQIDVYALGATYYKLLTAQVPDNAIDVLNNGLRTLPLVKKHVSQQSIDAIKAAMQPTTAKRLKTVQEFLDMLPKIDDATLFPEKTQHRSTWKRIGDFLGMKLGG